MVKAVSFELPIYQSFSYVNFLLTFAGGIGCLETHHDIQQHLDDFTDSTST